MYVDCWFRPVVRSPGVRLRAIRFVVERETTQTAS